MNSAWNFEFAGPAFNAQDRLQKNGWRRIERRQPAQIAQ